MWGEKKIFFNHFKILVAKLCFILFSHVKYQRVLSTRKQWKKILQSRHGSPCRGFIFSFNCSTDEAHNHKFCPDGELSWCKHKWALALAELAPANSHMVLRRTPCFLHMRGWQMKSCFAVFMAKPKTPLSLNSKTWLLCPGTRFAPCTVVVMATYTAILWFNKIQKNFEDVWLELSILPTRELIAWATRETSSQSTKKTRLKVGPRKGSEGTTKCNRIFSFTLLLERLLCSLAKVQANWSSAIACLKNFRHSFFFLHSLSL